MVESVREICGSVRVGVKTQRVRGGATIKATVRRKEAVWKRRKERLKDA